MKQKKTLKKLTALCAALVVSVTSVGASFSAFAAGSSGQSDISASQQQSLPAKFDLRNADGKNYVTPVKYQNPYGTCWAFSAAAAAETTLLYANGLGVDAGKENNNINLSEKYISWYAYTKLTDKDVKDGVVPKSQVGEGFVDANEITDYKTFYDKGGKHVMAYSLFANGMGPVDESANKLFEYKGENGWIFPNYDAQGEELEAVKKFIKKSAVNPKDPDMTEEEFEKMWADPKKRNAFLKGWAAIAGGGDYAEYDNWALPDGTEYRFAGTTAVLKQFKTLDDYKQQDEDTGEYNYSEKGLEAVKKEIASGHALACEIYGDSGTDMSVFNQENWAQYISNDNDGQYSANHGVTIVGYDDTYKKENFARDNDKNGKTDPGSIPPADGAFIIKNSYGNITEEDKKTAKTDPDTGEKEYSRVGANEFGIDNSGYFYISYYDVSLSTFSSMDFYKQDEVHNENNDQYDLLSVGAIMPLTTSRAETTSSANVFTAQQDEFLTQIGVKSEGAGTVLNYSIYKNPKNDDPTSGELLEKGEKTLENGGYFRIDLSGKYLLTKGDKYAVVAQFKVDDDGEDVNTAFIPISLGEGTGIINKGESFIQLDGKWYDLTEKSDSIRQKIYDISVQSIGEEAAKMKLPNGAKSVTIDNFAIKGFTTPALTRFAGNNRFDTAAKISSESGMFEKADTVVIANGLVFADALAGVSLAKAYNAPILLTETDSLAAETQAEIKRLGAKKAVILGGTSAVSEKAEAAVKAAGITEVERIAGAARFETAQKVAEALEKQTGKDSSEVFFVIYDNFADALSASTAAAVNGAPILYVSKDGAVDKYTQQYLSKHKDHITKGYVIGGAKVITDNMKDALSKELGGKTVERVWGETRYETCVAVNNKFASALNGGSICVAKGLDFPDALAGGVIAALKNAPLLLADNALNDAQTKYLSSNKFENIFVFGGTGAVPEKLAGQIVKAASAEK